MHSMNWGAYYASGAAPEGPSTFALAVEPLLARDCRLLDVGCGNGRDLGFFKAKVQDASGVDSATGSADFVSDAALWLGRYFPPSYDAIYMRWFLHAIPPKDQDVVLKLAACSLRPNGIIAIEARSVNGAHPVDHARWPVTPGLLGWKLESLGLDVESLGESTDYSPMGDDRPLLLRCIARRPELDDRGRVADGSAAVEGDPVAVGVAGSPDTQRRPSGWGSD